MKKIKTAVIGAGKMGGIHAKVYDQLTQSDFVAVADTDKEKGKELAEKYNCDFYENPDDLIGKVDAVTISTPTVHHYSIAEKFLQNRIPVMIEKPLASSIEQGKKIVELSKKYGAIAAVGHSERCNPVVQAMKRLEIEPKFIQANRISPFPFRSTDIGVVLDVMIHDIDIILSLANSDIKKVEAVGVNVIKEHEDICNARLLFDNGCVANVTASRLALKTERKVRVFSREAYLSLDYFKKTGIVIKTAPNVDVVEWVRENMEDENFDFSQVNWPDLLHIEELEIDDREPLRVEQESFLKAVANENHAPEVTAEEGLAAMQCADMILNSVKEHQWE